LTPHRRNRLLALLLLACGVVACSSPKRVFPSAGSVALTVTDSALRDQSTLTRASQVVRWTIVSAEVDFVGYGTYAFTGVSPCTYTKNVLVSSTLEKACGGSNLVLGTAGAWAATVHLVISAMEVRRAFIPDLPASGDEDGDGIANAVDNCPLVPNADQELSTDGTHGTACTQTRAGIVYVDTDGDGTVDAFDDCVWVPDADQSDSNADGIGDDCEQVARVVLDPVPLHLDLSPVTFAVQSGKLSTLIVDFDDGKVLENCDARFTRCTLNPEAVVVIVK
jgi:hypothetical protein